MFRALAIAVIAAGLLVPPAPAVAGSVPINAFERPGDLHVDFPAYAARHESSSEAQGDMPPVGLMKPVGDVNGDGRTDIAMAISSSHPSWTTAAWVTFSPGILPTSVDVNDPTWAGLKIVGAGTEIAGLAGLGDVNGDAIGDVGIIAASGHAWVVFGSPVPGTVDVSSLGDRGFTITGVSGCFAGAAGNGWTGVFTRNSSIHGVGDQNGDGRPDLALCDYAGVRVVYTPANPAGATVNGAELGEGGATLSTDAPNSMKLETIGDIDGDARTDVAVGWTHSDGVHVLATPLPAPGTTIPVGEQETAAKAWSAYAPGFYLERFGAIGDDNVDGRRDLTLSMTDQSGRRQMVVFGRELGTREPLLPLRAEVGRAIDDRGSGVTDVGDQDGDGRPDLAFDESMQLSSTGEWVSIADALPQCVTLRQLGPHSSLVLCSLEYKIVGALPDSNGDGKPELIAIHTDPLPVEDGVTRATWRLDVFPSAPRPEPQALAMPTVLPDGGLGFAGEFLTAPGGVTRSLAARAAVSVADGSGRVRSVAGELVDAGASASTRAVVAADAQRLGLSPGATYAYWMSLENGRGLTGVTAPKTFTYRPPRAARPALSRLRMRPARFRVRRGTRVTYSLSEAAVTTFRVARASRGGRWVTLRGRVRRSDEKGVNGFRLRARIGGRKLRPGVYRLTATPKSAAGVTGRSVSVRFRVLRGRG